MTRKTFKPVAAALLFSAVVASPMSQAYFPVSLPAGTLTMSGVEHAGRTMEPEREPTAVPEAAAPVARKTPPAQQTPPSRLRAAGAKLEGLVR